MTQSSTETASDSTTPASSEAGSEAIVKLKKGAERRLLQGHQWVFSNEIDVDVTPLRNFEAGQIVNVEARNGKLLGMGYINPATLISVRLLAGPHAGFSGTGIEDLLRKRLDTAFAWREQNYTTPWYRLVHAEGDLLPGLVVDRFDNVLVVQVTTAGIERYADSIAGHLAEITGASVVHFDNRSRSRALENLTETDNTAIGQLPDVLTVQENGCEFQIPATGGQKTGWFYDHRENRRLVAGLCKGMRVLDVFSYVGGWSIAAAKNEATEVTAVDSSRAALDHLESNAELNDVAGKLEVICGDAIEALKQLATAGKQYDVVIVDPPAFIKRKKDFKKGVQHYELLNRLSAKLVVSGGLLATASCSQAMPLDDLTAAARRAAIKSGSEMQILHTLSQGPDHPWVPGVPETRYLKGLLARLF